MRIVINEDSNSLKVENANKKYKQKQMHFFYEKILKTSFLELKRRNQTIQTLKRK